MLIKSFNHNRIKHTRALARISTGRKSIWFEFTVVLLCLATLNVQAQIKNMKRFDPPEGVNMGLITGIAQDAKGYMWFAGTGLYQYDGYHLKYYLNDPENPNSLGSNQLESVCADKNGIIWVGTQGYGLDRLDPSTGTFTHYRHNPLDVTSICHNKITVLKQDSEGLLWIGTHGGLDCLNPSTGKITHYRHNASDVNGLSCNQVRSIYEDKQGTLWIGTGSPFFHDDSGDDEGGLNRFDKKTGKFTTYLHNPNDAHSLINNKVCGILEDSHGNFWVGTAGDGLHTMNRTDGTFERHLYDAAQPEKLSRPPLVPSVSYDHIHFITEDAAGGIWIGTVLGGMNYYNTATKKVKRFDGAKAETGVVDNGFWSAYTSHEGVLWLSSWNGNLYYKDPIQKDIPQSEIGADCRVFVEQNADALWKGTNNGLIRTNRSAGISKNYLNDEGSKKLRNNSVYALYSDHLGDLWVGTAHGLNKYNKNTDNFTVFMHNDKDTTSIVSAIVEDIVDDKKGSLWLATEGGVERLNLEKNTFTHYVNNPNDTNSLSKNACESILVASSLSAQIGGMKEGIWVGATRGGGINLLDPETGKCKHYLKGRSIVRLFEDSDGVLWACTESGLLRYDKSKDGFSLFLDPQKNIRIERLYVGSMTEDNQKNLWISTSLGILKLNAARSEISVYGSNYGVTGLIDYNGSNKNSCYTGLNGALYFGSALGYYSFFPDSIVTNKKSPEIVLVDLRIGEQTAPKNVMQGGSLDEAKEIILNYKQNNFSFDFAGIHYTNPEINKHLFILENYQNTWRESGAEHTAYFYNVPPGHYVFKVKAASSNNVWAEKSVAITINPPWWLTWWAKFIFAALFIYGTWWFIKYQSRKIISENKRLEQKVSVRTAEIVKQKEEIQNHQNELQKNVEELNAAQVQLKQLDAAKTRFFANVSHELRTPLTLMLAPLGTMLKSKTLDNRNFTLATLARQHSQNLLGLVNEILDLTKLESGKMETHEEPTEIYFFIRRLVATFESYAAQKGISLQLDFNSNAPHALMLDKPKFEKIFNNLLSNALKFTPQGGKITVKITQTTDKWRLAVIDTGRGIHPNDLPHVFNRFYQTNEAEVPTEGGTGIGLALCNELAQVMGGKISVESTLGNGATFILELPQQEVFGVESGELRAEREEISVESGELSVERKKIPVESGELSVESNLDSTLHAQLSTILVVEDNASLRDYLKLILSDKYNVVTAENGEEALTLMRGELRVKSYDAHAQLATLHSQLKPDLIVSDIMMPIMDGFQLLEKLKENPQFQQIPVVMLTARAEMQDKLKALTFGVDDYLIKPFEEEELFARIKNLLANADARNQVSGISSQANSNQLSAISHQPTSELNADSSKPIAQNSLLTADKEWLTDLEKMVREHIEDSNLSVDSLAEMMFMSRAQFFRRVETLTGLTPLNYIQELRFNHARSLLEQRKVSSVKAVAAAIGIQKTQRFSEQFKERFGKLPSEYFV